MRQPKVPKAVRVGWNDLDPDENLHEELKQYAGKSAADCIFQLRVLPEDAYRVKKEPSNAGAYVSLSNICADVGWWDEVLKIRSQMTGIGVKKEPGWSFL